MATSFRAEVLDQILRTRGAAWVCGIIGAVGTVALLALAKWRHNPAAFGAPNAASGALYFLGVWCGLCGWLGVLSWRRLWRSGRTPLERWTYDLGVRGWGALMLISAPIATAIGVGAAVDIFRDPGAWLLVLACAFMAVWVGLPLCLWGGYVWGSFVGGNRIPISTDPHQKEPSDLPPLV